MSAWGNAQDIIRDRISALKARFSKIESRLQRLSLIQPHTWGVAPGYDYENTLSAPRGVPQRGVPTVLCYVRF